MSLLMDALKKAERARAARLEGEPDEPPGEAPLSLDPMEAAADDRSEAGGDSVQLPLPEEDETGFGLADTSPGEPVGAGGRRLELGPEATDDSLQLGLTDEQLSSAEDSLLSSRPRNREDKTLRDTSEIDDATAATLPSLKAAQDSVDSYFDGTNSSSLSMDNVLPPDDDTTITGQRATVEREAQQQSARAVFAAKATRTPSSGGRWALFLALPLVLGLTAAGGYFYWLASGGSSWDRAGSRATVQSSPVPAPGHPRVSTIEISRTDVASASRDRASVASPPRASAAQATAAQATAAQATPMAATPPVADSAPRLPAEPNPGQSRSVVQNAAPSAPSSGDLSPRTALASAEPTPNAVLPAGPAILTEAQFQEMLRKTSPVPKGLNSGAGIKVTRGQARDPSRRSSSALIAATLVAILSAPKRTTRPQ